MEIIITDVGASANELKSGGNCIVLFKDHVPSELAEISYLHDCQSDFEIKEGQTLTICDKSYKIIFVGNEVIKNFKELGHFSIVFEDDYQSEYMPGQIALKGQTYDKDINVSDIITINE